jgi:N-acetylmuramoyl-L-alanine amidase
MSIKVALDAGHGSDTWEKTGGKGIKYGNGQVFEEHTFNSAVVGYTKELLERNGIGVVLTQPLNHNDVPLKARTDLANSLGVDILVSFHADANANLDAKGHWAFYWYNSDKSKKLAQTWDKYANQILGNPCRGLQESKPNNWTDFHMVRETKMPAILIEHAFMTNKEDLQRLLSDDFRRKCAEVATRAICEYFGVIYKEGVGDMKFCDTKGHWAEKSIDIVSEKGFMVGFSDGTFKPDESVTRAQLAKVLNDVIYWVEHR